MFQIARAIIKHNDKYLLVRRASSDVGAGFWQFPGGNTDGQNPASAVKREVKEEVGIDITNLRYMGSQPWPFPHSLMTAFIADYQSGELVCQPDEIEEAQWFDMDQLPEVPMVATLSGQIIRYLAEGGR
jgi:NAD+ diphosphatase